MSMDAFNAVRAPTDPSSLLAFHSDTQLVSLPKKHRFPMAKYKLTRQALEEDTSLEGLIEIREVSSSPEGLLPYQ